MPQSQGTALTVDFHELALQGGAKKKVATGTPQKLNRYSYATNNPVRLIDPSGHAIIDSGGEEDTLPGAPPSTNGGLANGSGNPGSKPPPVDPQPAKPIAPAPSERNTGGSSFGGDEGEGSNAAGDPVSPPTDEPIDGSPQETQQSNGRPAS